MRRRPSSTASGSTSSPIPTRSGWRPPCPRCSSPPSSFLLWSSFERCAAGEGWISVATVKQVEPGPAAPGGAGTSLPREARRAHRRRRLGSTGRHAALALATLVFVVPFYFVILASVKNSDQIFSYPPKLLPFPLYFGNFKELLSQTQFLRWLLNTLIVAGSVAAIKVLIDSMAGYALAKLQITGKRIIFILMLILLMVPLSALIVPLWTLIRMFGLLDTYWALILPALANPLGV